MSNPRFAEYVTSGAFTLTLSRHQIHALGMTVGGETLLTDGSLSALERKGLVELVAAPVPDEPDRSEVRPTHAGLLALQMLAEAGLGNGSNAVADELASLREQLAAARKDAADARERAWSCAARQDTAEAKLATFQRELAYRRQAMAPGGLRLRGDEGEPWPDPRPVKMRDRHPGLSDVELRAGLGPQPKVGVSQS